MEQFDQTPGGIPADPDVSQPAAPEQPAEPAPAQPEAPAAPEQPQPEQPQEAPAEEPEPLAAQSTTHAEGGGPISEGNLDRHINPIPSEGA